MRYTRDIRAAAMRDHFGRLLAERRKTFFAKLMKLPRIREVELIHAHFMGWAFEVALPLGQILQVPVTLTVHNVDLPTRRLTELEYMQQHAAKIVLVSEAYKQIWVDRTGSLDRLVVVPNGVELSEFSRTPTIRTPEKGLKIISISRLVPGKRIADALKALARLRDDSVQFSYVAIGEGPERAALEQLAHQLGLDNQVAFPGAKPHAEVVKELCAADILIHPSEWESFGIAVVEAMAAGVPVIAARSPGPSDTVNHGVTGFLYTPGDVDMLSNHLQQLVNEPVLRQRFAEIGQVRARERFSWDAHMGKMLELWQAALACPRQHPSTPLSAA